MKNIIKRVVCRVDLKKIFVANIKNKNEEFPSTDGVV
jgi:hypothetical protein